MEFACCLVLHPILLTLESGCRVQHDVLGASLHILGPARQPRHCVVKSGLFPFVAWWGFRVIGISVNRQQKLHQLLKCAYIQLRRCVIYLCDRVPTQILYSNSLSFPRPTADFPCTSLMNSRCFICTFSSKEQNLEILRQI